MVEEDPRSRCSCSLALARRRGATCAYNRLDVIAHYAIEKYGPEITGVPIKVKDVEVSAADGKGALQGVEIGTPAASARRAPRALGEIRVRGRPGHRHAATWS